MSSVKWRPFCLGLKVLSSADLLVMNYKVISRQDGVSQQTIYCMLVWDVFVAYAQRNHHRKKNVL